MTIFISIIFVFITSRRQMSEDKISTDAKKKREKEIEEEEKKEKIKVRYNMNLLLSRKEIILSS